MKPLRRLLCSVLWAISNVTGQWAWDADPDVDDLRALARHGALPAKPKPHPTPTPTWEVN